jgi:hypothetical protein
VQSDSSASFLKRLEDSVLRQYGNSSAYDNGDDSDSGSEDGVSRRQDRPYNPTGYAPPPLGRQMSGAQHGQKPKISQGQSGPRGNPIQRQGSAGSSSSPPQRTGPSVGRPSQQGGRGPSQQQRQSSPNGRAGRGRPSAPHQQSLHSPIKPPATLHSQGESPGYFGHQSQPHHQQGPYEYQPPTRSRNTEAAVQAEGARDRKFNMLSQPTASSRARVTMDGNTVGRGNISPSRRSDAQGMNFSTRNR